MTAALPPVFTEKQVAALLKRATELQERGARRHEPANGLTLAEVEAMAADLGIDPAYIREAAAEVAAPDDAGSPRFLGVPRTNRVDRLVEAPLSEEAWSGVVQEIRRTFDSSGRTNRIGKANEWTDPFGLASVSLTPEEDRTRVRIEYRYTAFVGFAYFLAAIYSVMGFGAATESLEWMHLWEWLFAGGGVAGVLGATRAILRHRIRRHGRKLQRLSARIESVLASTAVATGEDFPRLADESQAAIDVPEEEETGPAAQRRRTLA